MRLKALLITINTGASEATAATAASSNDDPFDWAPFMSVVGELFERLGVELQERPPETATEPPKEPLQTPPPKAAE